MTNIQYYKGAIDPMGCISNGWNLIKPNYGMYFAICLLAMLMILVVSCIPCFNIILAGPLTTVIIGGIYFILLKDMRGEPVEFGMMFKGFEKFLPLALIGLIQSIPGIIFQILQWTLDIGKFATDILRQGGDGVFFQQSASPDLAIEGGFLALYLILAVVFFIFSIGWSITFWFAVPLIIEHDIGPIEAIKLSARAGWGNFIGLLVLLILSALILFAGFVAICIGMFLVIPLLYAASAFAYRQVFPALERGPATFNTPPPPTEYAGSFGQGN